MTAAWASDSVTQGIEWTRVSIVETFQMPREKMRVISPFVCGAFVCGRLYRDTRVTLPLPLRYRPMRCAKSSPSASPKAYWRPRRDAGQGWTPVRRLALDWRRLRETTDAAGEQRHALGVVRRRGPPPAAHSQGHWHWRSGLAAQSPLRQHRVQPGKAPGSHFAAQS